MVSLDFSKLSLAKVCTYEILLEKILGHQEYKNQESTQLFEQVKIEIQAANYSESVFVYGSSLQNVLTEARLPNVLEVTMENPSVDSSTWDLGDFVPNDEEKIQNPDTDPNLWGYTNYDDLLMENEESSTEED